MTEPVKRFLDALERTTGQTATGNGKGQFTARCPAHDDHRDSLCIGTGSDHKCLVKCQANKGCTVETITAAVGLNVADLMPNKPGQQNGHHQNGDGKQQILARYPYRDETGLLLFEVCRMGPKKDFRQRRPKPGGGWEWTIKNVRKVLYRLLDLLKRTAEPVFITEGEKDADRLFSLGFLATSNAGGAGKWKTEYSEPLRGRHCIIIADNDQPGRDHAEAVARSLQGKAASVKVLYLPDLPPKGDVSDWLDAGGTPEVLVKLAEATPLWTPKPISDGNDQHADDEEPAAEKGPNAATALVGKALPHLELFHVAEDREAYASLEVDGHRENHRIRGGTFKDFLRRLWWEETHRTIGENALNDAIGTLTGIAMFDGADHAVHVRLAADPDENGVVWLDLGDETWSAVCIDKNGWQIVDGPTVRFIRPGGIKPLPRPVHGGHLRELRQFLNAPSDDTWVLMQAFIVGCLRATGPYPILAIQGEQGSAKSTSSRLIRAIVDPNKSGLRSTPRNEQDLILAATNQWLVGFDNFSFVQDWLSDSLCRLSTGGGFGCRKHYSNDEEKLFESTRPVLLNGIPSLASRPDLMDRTVAVNLPTIPESNRRTEAIIWKQFAEAQPRILGAVLNAVSCGLRRLHEVRLDSPPRMADFAHWVVACEPALDCQPGAFLDAYAGNREELNELAVEDSIIGGPILGLLRDGGRFTGTATDLLNALQERTPEKVQKQRDWPKKSNALSGQLRRIAPNLRRMGVEIELDGRDRDTRRKVIDMTLADPEEREVFRL